MNVQLEYLEVQITDSCNLNCKGCSHCAGLMEKDRHIPVASFARDLTRLHQLIPAVKKIRLLGGEPFLNPGLEEYCRIARDIFPDADIRITTNGILCLGRDADFYRRLRELDIGIDLSLYPPTMKILPELKKLFEDNGIRYKCTEQITKFAKRITLKGNADPETSFWNCNSKWCNFLRDGVLCLCPMPVVFGWLSDRYHFSADTESGKLDIYDPTLTGESVVRFLNTPNQTCRYCTELEFFQWQANVEPKLEDWVVEKTE